jgi:hypothetical protein
VHGLILDSPPLAVEAACWQRVLGPGIGARVFVVPPEPLIPGPLALEPPGREASRDRGEGAFVIAQLGGAADSWQAIGVQAFQIWAHGCYGRCETCRALSLDRLLSPVARYEPRSACLYCGSGRLVRPGGRPEAQLAVTLLEEEVGAPDPRVVAEWLGASQQVSVVGAGDEPEARLRSALAEADVALLLGPTAFPGPWLDAARAAGLACVTNDAGGGESEASILIRSAHYTWDSRSHVTGRPALPQLIRALETAFSRRGELRRDAEPPAQRPEVAKAWGGALEALSQAPQRRRRLRRPRWAGGRWA